MDFGIEHWLLYKVQAHTQMRKITKHLRSVWVLALIFGSIQFDLVTVFVFVFIFVIPAL